MSMIDMSSMSKDEINAWAEENKITIIYDEAYSDSIASGKVITTSVDANTIIHQGDTVTVTLSKGKQKTEAEVHSQQNLLAIQVQVQQMKQKIHHKDLL